MTSGAAVTQVSGGSGGGVKGSGLRFGGSTMGVLLEDDDTL